jgi:sugar lactone lactonase YvrE
MTPDIAVVADVADEIGEIPTWDEKTETLYWLDMIRPVMHAYRPANGATTTWTTPEQLSAFALRADGSFLAASREWIAFYHPAANRWERLCEPEPLTHADNFLNDGRCDRRGRFWIGSGSFGQKKASGFLHRFDPDRKLSTHRSGITLTNSLAWSPDGRVMYFCDSMTRTIEAYDYDLDTGAIANRREFAKIPRAAVPDGSIVDAEGCLWNAEFDFDVGRTRGFIVRYDPKGRVERMIELPTARATALTFGGPKLDILYVVTSRFHMPAEALAQQPLAGSLLALEVGVRGLREPRFGG